MPLKILALDLERTLITNCINRQARPGLYDFLKFCLESFEKVIIFTGVDEGTTWEVLDELVEKGAIPKEFIGQLEIIDWSGEYKDLNFISDASVEEILIIDDDESYILPEQKSQWVSIKPYDPPGVNPWLAMEVQGEPDEDEDQELRFIQKQISKILEENNL